ncbi:MAG TPA: hypothetical protein V6C78_01895 [Crinalium sp.]|jgi:L-fucose mutarotase/ribose pyranase (RbsD/FucU family)
MLKSHRAIALMIPIFLTAVGVHSAQAQPNNLAAASKPDECNSLITTANQAMTNLQWAVLDSTNSSDSNQALLQIAEIADQASATMQTLELTDGQLQTFRDRYVTIYTSAAQANRDLVTAVRQQNSQAAQQAYETITTSTQQEEPLINEINSYCQVGG